MEKEEIRQIGQKGQKGQIGQKGQMGQIGQKGQMGQIGQKGQMGQIGQKGEEEIEVKQIGEWRYVRKGEVVQKVRVHQGEEKRIKDVEKKMVQGITTGYRGVLKLNGVGYRAEMKEGKIELRIGYKEPKRVEIGKGVEIRIEENGTKIVGQSRNKAELRQVMSTIEEIRPARKDKYKGKGIAAVE